MDRMVRDTKNPDLLRELFAALDDDPFLIAECLARPVLVDRLARDWYARDVRFHGSVKRQAEEALEAFPGDAVWMPDLGGEYHETEWRRGAERSAAIERLAELPLNRVSPLTEENDRFTVTAVLSKQEDRIRTATVIWNKRPFDAWWAEEGTAGIESDGGLDLYPVLPPVGGFHPVSAPIAALATDTWTATSTGANVPTARFVHTAVWTGTEMIVWGGSYLNTGGRYDPATDSWTPTSTASGVPSGRESHTAVWTGTEMIVWGGSDGSYLNTGGRYDPATDSWTATSTASGVPSARDSHTAVWTGTEMIVWGGDDGSYAEHRRTVRSCDRQLDGDLDRHRRAIRQVLSHGGLDRHGDDRLGRVRRNVRGHRRTVRPCDRQLDGDLDRKRRTVGEALPHGGLDRHGDDRLGRVGPRRTSNSGGRYDPATDSWTATSTASGVPSGRLGHTAVWTGTEMIVWGGVALVSGEWINPNTGGRYDPATNSWTATSTASGVPLGRHSYAAVWTGTEMIVWGGLNNNYGYLNDGGLYRACEGGSVATWYPDTDGDGYGLSSTGVPICAQPAGYVAEGGDCAPDNSDIHPAAAEINDGLDNQCPGDAGYGLVDEIDGVCGFHNAGDRDEFSWTAQAGATSYEVARCAKPQFSSGCTKETTSATSWSDGEPVAQGDCHHYLVRTLAPHAGSWGFGALGTERTGIYP